MSKADRESFEAVTDALTAYFEPKKNVFYQRRIFMSRVQKANESNFQFIDAVRKLAHHIEVNDKDDKNVWILSVLVNGLRDRKQAERIQLLDNVNLDKTISTLIATGSRSKARPSRASKGKL